MDLHTNQFISKKNIYNETSSNDKAYPKIIKKELSKKINNYPKKKKVIRDEDKRQSNGSHEKLFLKANDSKKEILQIVEYNILPECQVRKNLANKNSCSYKLLKGNKTSNNQYLNSKNKNYCTNENDVPIDNYDNEKNDNNNGGYLKSDPINILGNKENISYKKLQTYKSNNGHDILIKTEPKQLAKLAKALSSLRGKSSPKAFDPNHPLTKNVKSDLQGDEYSVNEKVQDKSDFIMNKEKDISLNLLGKKEIVKLEKIKSFNSQNQKNNGEKADINNYRKDLVIKTSDFINCKRNKKIINNNEYNSWKKIRKEENINNITNNAPFTESPDGYRGKNEKISTFHSNNSCENEDIILGENSPETGKITEGKINGRRKNSPGASEDGSSNNNIPLNIYDIEQKTGHFGDIIIHQKNVNKEINCVKKEGSKKYNYNNKSDIYEKEKEKPQKYMFSEEDSEYSNSIKILEPSKEEKNKLILDKNEKNIGENSSKNNYYYKSTIFRSDIVELEKEKEKEKKTHMKNKSVFLEKKLNSTYKNKNLLKNKETNDENEKTKTINIDGKKKRRYRHDREEGSSNKKQIKDTESDFDVDSNREEFSLHPEESKAISEISKVKNNIKYRENNKKYKDEKIQICNKNEYPPKDIIIHNKKKKIEEEDRVQMLSLSELEDNDENKTRNSRLLDSNEVDKSSKATSKLNALVPENSTGNKYDSNNIIVDSSSPKSEIIIDGVSSNVDRSSRKDSDNTTFMYEKNKSPINGQERNFNVYINKRKKLTQNTSRDSPNSIRSGKNNNQVNKKNLYYRPSANIKVESLNKKIASPIPLKSYNKNIYIYKNYDSNPNSDIYLSQIKNEKKIVMQKYRQITTKSPPIYQKPRGNELYQKAYKKAHVCSNKRSPNKVSIRNVKNMENNLPINTRYKREEFEKEIVKIMENNNNTHNGGMNNDYQNITTKNIEISQKEYNKKNKTYKCKNSNNMDEQYPKNNEINISNNNIKEDSNKNNDFSSGTERIITNSNDYIQDVKFLKENLSYGNICNSIKRVNNLIVVRDKVTTKNSFIKKYLNYGLNKPLVNKCCYQSKYYKPAYLKLLKIMPLNRGQKITRVILKSLLLPFTNDICYFSKYTIRDKKNNLVSEKINNENSFLEDKNFSDELDEISEKKNNDNLNLLLVETESNKIEDICMIPLNVKIEKNKNNNDTIIENENENESKSEKENEKEKEKKLEKEQEEENKKEKIKEDEQKIQENKEENNCEIKTVNENVNGKHKKRKKKKRIWKRAGSKDKDDNSEHTEKSSNNNKSFDKNCDNAILAEEENNGDKLEENNNKNEKERKTKEKEKNTQKETNENDEGNEDNVEYIDTLEFHNEDKILESSEGDDMFQKEKTDRGSIVTHNYFQKGFKTPDNKNGKIISQNIYSNTNSEQDININNKERVLSIKKQLNQEILEDDEGTENDDFKIISDDEEELIRVYKQKENEKENDFQRNNSKIFHEHQSLTYKKDNYNNIEESNFKKGTIGKESQGYSENKNLNKKRPGQLSPSLSPALIKTRQGIKILEKLQEKRNSGESSNIKCLTNKPKKNKNIKEKNIILGANKLSNILNSKLFSCTTEKKINRQQNTIHKMERALEKLEEMQEGKVKDDHLYYLLYENNRCKTPNLSSTGLNEKENKNVFEFKLNNEGNNNNIDIQKDKNGDNIFVKDNKDKINNKNIKNEKRKNELEKTKFCGNKFQTYVPKNYDKYKEIFKLQPIHKLEQLMNKQIPQKSKEDLTKNEIPTFIQYLSNNKFDNINKYPSETIKRESKTYIIPKKEDFSLDDKLDENENNKSNGTPEFYADQKNKTKTFMPKTEYPLDKIKELQNKKICLDSNLLPKEVINHCTELLIRTYTEELKEEDKNEILREKKISNQSPINRSKSPPSSKAEKNSIEQWSRKDMTKENEEAEKYVKELRLNMSKDILKYKIIEILNTITVDNYDNVLNTLIDVLYKLNPNHINNSSNTNSNINNTILHTNSLGLLKPEYILHNQCIFVEIIFDKAINEKGYVVLYARLCNDLYSGLFSLVNLYENNETKKKIYDGENLKTILIDECRQRFDECEDVNAMKNKELFLNVKKKFLGNINFIAELINVKIISQKIGFEFLDNLYKQYKGIKDNDEFKYLNLEAAVTLLSKFGKIVFQRQSPRHLQNLDNYIKDNLYPLINNESNNEESNIDENLPNYIKYKIINLIEKKKDNWKDSLFEKSIIAKGKNNSSTNNISKVNKEENIDFESNKNDCLEVINYKVENQKENINKIESQSSCKKEENNENEIIRKLRNDIEKYIIFLREHNIKEKIDLMEDVNNYYDWSAIDDLIMKYNVHLEEIIRCFVEVCIDFNVGKNIFAVKEYIKNIINYYSAVLTKEQIENIHTAMTELFLNLDNICSDNDMFQVMGFLLFALIKNKLFFKKDFKNFIKQDKSILIKLAKVIKFTILFADNESQIYFNNLQQTKLYIDNVDIFTNYVVIPLKEEYGLKIDN